MSRWKLTVAGVLAGLTLVGGAVTVVLDLPHAPDSPDIHIPTGPRAAESFDPYHIHEERHKGPPQERVTDQHVASTSATNVAGEISVEPVSRQSVQPLVLAVLLTFAVFLGMRKHHAALSVPEKAVTR